MCQPGQVSERILLKVFLERQIGRGFSGWQKILIVLLAIASVTVALTSCTQTLTRDPNPHPTRISLSLDGCAKAWSQPRGGQQQFELHNDAGRPLEVTLNSVAQQEVFASVDGLGPDVSRVITVDLPNGEYQFKCLPEDADAIASEKVSISNAPTGDQGSPHAKAVTFQDLVGPAQSYQKWVQGQLPALTAQSAQLAQTVAAGDVAAAKTQWLQTHKLYESLGAAYGAFGDLDGKINGTTAGLSVGLTSSDFVGFHALESALWRPERALAASAADLAAGLAVNCAELEKTFAQERVNPLDIGLRAHEIMENALQKELTGRTDYGSASNLQTVRANLDGTAKLLEVLKPVTSARMPNLSAIEAAVSSAGGLIDSAIAADANKQKINSTIAELTETLADVAAVCDIRRTA